MCGLPHVSVSASGISAPAAVVVPAPCGHPSPRAQKTSMFSVSVRGERLCTPHRSSSSRVRSILSWQSPRQVKVWQVPSALLRVRSAWLCRMICLENIIFQTIQAVPAHQHQEPARSSPLQSGHSLVPPEADTRAHGGRKEGVNSLWAVWYSAVKEPMVVGETRRSRHQWEHGVAVPPMPRPLEASRTPRSRSGAVKVCR